MRGTYKTKYIEISSQPTMRLGNNEYILFEFKVVIITLNSFNLKIKLIHCLMIEIFQNVNL